MYPKVLRDDAPTPPSHYTGRLQRLGSAPQHVYPAVQTGPQSTRFNMEINNICHLKEYIYVYTTQHISFTAYYKNKYLFTMPTIISQFHKEPEYTETYLFLNIPFIWHLSHFWGKRKRKSRTWSCHSRSGHGFSCLPAQSPTQRNAPSCTSLASSSISQSSAQPLKWSIAFPETPITATHFYRSLAS